MEPGAALVRGRPRVFHNITEAVASGAPLQLRTGGVMIYSRESRLIELALEGEAHLSGWTASGG